MRRTIYIGCDSREREAVRVAKHSMLRRMSRHVPVEELHLDVLQGNGVYTRPTMRVGGYLSNRLIDKLSARADYDGSMSTEHAIARFFVPQLAGDGWALFVDGDILVRADICEIFDGLDPDKAIYCVQHEHAPTNVLKKDNQVQTIYQRKNWSSVMLFNCDHELNRDVLPNIVNVAPGRELHAFSWLDDDEIGALDPAWNYLVGYSDPHINPKIVHYTEGLPNVRGYEDCDYASDWRAERARLSDACLV